MIKMAMNAENVVKLQTESSIISERIEKFLKRKGHGSERTLTTYRKAIEDFFMVIRGKDVKYLNMDDIQVTLDDFDDFIIQMSEETIFENGEEVRRFQNNTINLKVEAVKSLLRYLHEIKINGERLVKDISYINSKLVERLKDTHVSHGFATVEDIYLMAKWILDNEKKKKHIKYYAVLFSLDTCIRKKALLNIKWSDFRVENNVVKFNTIDKGNKELKADIGIEFYRLLETLKTDSEELVFPLDERTITRMWSRMKEDPEMKFIEDRNIKFHSIRKAGATFKYREHNDIFAAQKALNHSNLNNLLRYIDAGAYNSRGAVSSLESCGLDIIEEVDHKTLLEAILNDMTQDYKITLAMKLKEKCQNKSISVK
jgi:integrase